MTTLFGRTWTRDELESRCGDFSQIAGVTQVTLSDGAARGVRAVIFRTGTGLEFWVLIDRAFDLARCHFRGVELGWQSPVGIRAPWFHEVNDEGGSSFLRSFSGFLVTGGLDHTGAPHHGSAAHYFTTDRSGIDQPLHGRLLATPGQLVSYGHEWRGDRCVLYCEGIVKQAAVFGEHLVLTRRYEAVVGESSFTLRDRVRNAAYFKTPHMLLYHFNLGFPLLDEGSEFISPTQAIQWAARDARADGIGYRLQRPPQPDCLEQVYVHRTAADADGRVRAALVNRQLQAGAGLGVALEFSKQQLPYLVQWQNFQAGSYAMAIEPATHHAVGRPHAETHGELLWLNHGDEKAYEVKISVLDGAGDIARFESAVRALVPTPPDPFALPEEPIGSL